MPNLKVTIPLLVIPEEKKYRISPLFTGKPSIVVERLDQGMRAIKKEIKYFLTIFEFSRKNADALLWLIFNAPYELTQEMLYIPAGKTGMSGNMLYITYRVREFTFVLLPDFDHYHFMADSSTPIRDQVGKVMGALIKAHKKSLSHKEIFEFGEFVSKNKTFITTMEMNITVRLGDFSFMKRVQENPFGLMNESKKFDGSVEIHQVGQELNDLYPDALNRAHQRDELVGRIKNQIFHGNRTPIAIIGKKGVGKKTLVHEAIYQYMKAGPRDKSRLQKIYHINPNRVIAGMSIIGWWTRRFTEIVEYARDRISKLPNGNRLSGYSTDHLLFDNPVALLRIGQTSKSKLSLQNVLLSYLEKREVGTIIIATPEEWQIMQEKSRRFADLFQVIRISEMSYPTAATAIIEQRRLLEQNNSCAFNIAAIDQIFNLQRNFFPQQALPGSVMKIMNQLAAGYRHKTIDLEEVRLNFQQYSGLDIKIFDESHELEAQEVETFINQHLVGQPEAVTALADTIHQVKAKLHNPRRPFGSFIFIGPTGVGKTQAAKVLAQYLTGSESQLIRFDMNEFIEPDSVERLIGTYYDPEGLLTGKVRYQPFGIILFDEIEKAHPSVYDLLLQVLDDGRLTDSLGRTVDFTNTIIIMTSNIGARDVSSQLGFETNTRSDRAIYESALKKHFRPEFVNRINKVVIFDPLSFDHILNIARLQIQELLSRDGFVRRTTILNISKEALHWVARRGYNKKMGGRALKRQIERDLTMLSAEQLIETQDDLPILFEIDIDKEKDQLTPNIQPLKFANTRKNSLPKLPEIGKGMGFLKRKLSILEKLEAEVNQSNQEEADQPMVITASDNPEQLDWQYYNFKNNLATLKEELTTMILGYNSNYYRPKRSPNYRFKFAIFPTDDNGVTIENQFLDKDNLEQITENYTYARPAFDNMTAELLAAHIDVSIMADATRYFLKATPDTIKLSFVSCIEGLGEKEIEFLYNLYTKLFEHLEIGFEAEEETHTIKASGYGITNLLKNEAGISLFYQSHQNPIPIITKLHIEDKNYKDQPKASQVIRMFDLQKTMTDFRTGLTNVAHLNTEELLVLVIGGAN